ncbi:Rossmann-fold NAD(P)-binding domain-containing protein [Alienimonas californiensis]|uniref:hypothetical protein n=1 Tax=Alienimonas californiensis TaxID=2527989 RepID=UPI0011A6FDC8|nr:hypothetical protein [Alienimonas californiensis]
MTIFVIGAPVPPAARLSTGWSIAAGRFSPAPETPTGPMLSARKSRRCDYDDPAAMRTTSKGIDVLMLIPSLTGVKPRIRQHADTLAAQDTEVNRVVPASFMAAEPDSPFQRRPVPALR